MGATINNPKYPIINNITHFLGFTIGQNKIKSVFYENNKNYNPKQYSNTTKNVVKTTNNISYADSIPYFCYKI